ncbi:MAG: hypothetical protein HKN36_02025 [Hellea sp.]|nr:hypothetical protein [Hellea sp.]
MKLRTVLIAGIAFGAGITPASAADLNMKAGDWKLVMKAEVFGTPTEENANECTNSDDLSATTSGFVNDMLAEMDCSISSSSDMLNLFEGNFVCDVDAPFEGGTFELMYSPTMISLLVDANVRAPLENKEAVITVLTHRVGPCTD